MKTKINKTDNPNYYKDRYKNNKEKNIIYQKQYYKDNKDKVLKYQKEYLEKNLDKIKIHRKKYNDNPINKLKKKQKDFKKRYNITIEEYNLLYKQQEGKCKICGKSQQEIKKALAVDHNHSTDKVRGLLCFKCNYGIGMFNEDINLLNKAIIYLNS